MIVLTIMVLIVVPLCQTIVLFSAYCLSIIFHASNVGVQLPLVLILNNVLCTHFDSVFKILINFNKLLALV